MYVPAGTDLAGPEQPGDEVFLGQSMVTTVGTPLCKAATRFPEPLTQSAELQIRVGPSLITSARWLGPMLNEHGFFWVETTLRLKPGS